MNKCKPLKKLSHEHENALLLAIKLEELVKQADKQSLLEGILILKNYNETELESHLQHEEQTIFSPLIQQYEEYRELCIQLGKEHGFLRTLIESITLETAKKDLAEFAYVLKNHSLVEENELFPLLDSLLTEEQMELVNNFTPFKRKLTPQTSKKESQQSTPKSSSEWLKHIKQHHKAMGKNDGSIILFPRYRPDLYEMLAEQLGFELFDYQTEEMSKQGVSANCIDLEQLTNTLHRKSQRNALISHNIEALLCVKSTDERRGWLQYFLDTDWPNPIYLPITIYQEDVPKEHNSVCDIELLNMPKHRLTTEQKLTSRIQYDVKIA